MKQIINYISVNPGVGKTHYVINELAKGILTKTQISIYVAPTVKLLEQVQADLRKKIPKSLHGKVIVFKQEAGDTVAAAVKAFLTGDTSFSGLKKTEEPQGSVLLMTHAGFLTLPSYIPRQGLIHLFFDEARKCVAEKNRVQLKGIRQALALSKVCSSIQAVTGAEQFKRIWCPDDAYQQLVKANKINELGFDSKQLRAIKPYLDTASNLRFDVYFRYDVKTNVPSLNFFELIVPSKIFDDFKKVTLMSAFFEDSQMYHLLKYTNKVELVNITEKIKTFEDRISDIQDRYEKVDIVALTKHTKVLTLSNLTSGMLVNRSLKEASTKFLDLNLNNKKSIYILKVHLDRPGENVVEGNYKEALSLIKKNPTLVELNPLDWYITRSLAVIKKWKSRYRLNGKPLLFTNSSFQKTLFDETNPLEINKNWELLTTSVHGLNTFSNRNAAVFLAAINPSPSLIEFYKHVFPGYDFEADHVADVCIQCISRTSVRNTDCVDRVLVVVPDRVLQTHVFTKMMGMPRVIPSPLPKENMIFVEKSKNKTLGKKAKSDSENAKNWQENNPLMVELAYLKRKAKFYSEKMEDPKTSKEKKYAFETKLIEKNLQIGVINRTLRL